MGRRKESRRPPLEEEQASDGWAAEEEEWASGSEELLDQPTEVVEFPAPELDEEGEDEQEGGSAAVKGSKKKTGGFLALGLSAPVRRSVMRKGYRVPTPIQRKAIPPILAGQDVVAMARTGSGKTAAFLLPMFDKLGGHSTIVGVRAAILSPTRELALQTHRFCVELSHFVSPPLRFCLLVGGDSMEDQYSLLAANPDVIVATPGRLQHVLLDSQLSLSKVEYIVFDEADRLFEMGFATQLHAIMASIPESRQTLLFSATMPAILADFTRASLHDPIVLRLDLETKLSESLQIEFLRVRPQDKQAALLIVLGKILKREAQTIVFASTRHHVEMLYALLLQAGFEATAIYGTLDPAARKIAIGKFRAGKAKILVVTDVAARGIDVPLLDNVVNFDFPTKPKLFVHRCGRAARAGRAGTAISLVEPDEVAFLYDVALYLGRRVTPTPSEAEAHAEINAGGKQTSGEGSARDSDEIQIGRFPVQMLAAEVEYVQSVYNENPDAAELARVATRATQMYRKTRGVASKMSVTRARSLPAELGVHPLLLGNLDVAAEASRLSLISRLQTFRPGAAAIGADGTVRKRVAKAPSATNDAATAGGSAPWAAAAACGAPTSVAAAVHAGDRVGGTLRDGVALKAKKRRVGADFRDSEFYMAPMKDAEPTDDAEEFLRVGQGDAHDALGQAVLDLIEDEREGIRRKRSVMRWDARKKKYVRETLGAVGVGAAELLANRGGKRMRDESGNLIPLKVGKAGKDSSDGELYSKWMKASKRRIQAPGESEEARVGGHAAYAQQKMLSKRKAGRWHTATKALPNSGVKSELRSEEQIGKMRRDKAKKAGKGGGKGGGAKGTGRGSGGRGGKGSGRGIGKGGRGAGNPSKGRPSKGKATKGKRR